MEIPTSFWIPGFMPMQFLLVFVAAFVLFIAGQYVLKQWGRPVTAFWQGVFIWVAAYGILKWVVTPPLPASLFYTYMGMVTVATFCYVSATEDSWAQCLRTMTDFFRRQTAWSRLRRGLVFTAMPILAAWAVYATIVPSFEAPVELRTDHPAPPRTITVHGERIDLQTAKNPFRVDEGLRRSADQRS
jgi:hypothetical protein